jgi:hypothetical protein
LETARCLGLDHLAVEVSSALVGAGIRALLLKGAALATWLYEDGTLRPYGDADLLVAPADFGQAERVLRGLGFVALHPGLSAIEEGGRARVWTRAGATVDLHRGLCGVGIDPALAWSVLTADVETLAVGGGRVEVLGRPARALHVALHAAQHGPSHPKPGQDVSRAVAQLPTATWQAAADLAARLDAREAMAAGLRLDPQGARLAALLDLPAGASLAIAVRAASATRGAASLAELIGTAGFGAKAAYFARRAVPTPAGLRAEWPAARRSFATMAVGYVWVPLWRASRLPRAVLAVARASRENRTASRQNRAS